MISTISPIYNEEVILSNNGLAFQELARKTELIFVDGGSSDRSVEIAKHYAKVLYSKKGRATQMNEGAYSAKGDILLFLHADTTVSLKALDSIERKVSRDAVIGGCLTQRIDKKTPIYRLIETQGNTRARLSKIFYGDQGIFVRRDVFFELKGFPEVPIMEDVLFSMKLRKVGKTTVLPEPITVSARRWERDGIIKTTLLYSLSLILFRLKFPLERIKLLYEDLDALPGHIC